MAALKILSGGAAQALVGRMADGFQRETGLAIEGTFGAVGAMRDKLVGGAECDVVILTQALIDQLVADGRVAAGSGAALGVVMTGVAVRQGQPHPQVSTPDALRSVLGSAAGIYFPDPVKATAGIHFMKVLKTLGLDQSLAPRLRSFPNGAIAMREMASAPERNVVGCTQVTEILLAPGVELVGLLPREFELATVYTAAVSATSQSPDAAAAFVRRLSDPAAAAQRAALGFVNG